jgi:hypothetical protein
MKLTEPWYHKPDINFGASAGAKGSSGARHAGILYHRKFYNVLKLHTSVNLAGMRLLVEPWFQAKSGTRRSPDAVLIDDVCNRALVIEVKLNWKNEREEKLMNEYLPIVEAALGVKTVPLLVAGSIINYKGKPLLGLSQLNRAWAWMPDQPPSIMLWTGK